MTPIVLQQLCQKEERYASRYSRGAFPFAGRCIDYLAYLPEAGAGTRIASKAVNSGYRSRCFKPLNRQQVKDLLLIAILTLAALAMVYLVLLKFRVFSNL